MRSTQLKYIHGERVSSHSSGNAVQVRSKRLGREVEAFALLVHGLHHHMHRRVQLNMDSPHQG